MRARKKILGYFEQSLLLSRPLSQMTYFFCRRVIKEEYVIKMLVGQLAWLVVYLCRCMLC